jgi:hypothetical protein
VYVRRWLLLLAAGFLVAWIVVQLLPSKSDDSANPTSTATVTALPSASPTTPAPKPKPTTPKPTVPAEGSTTKVALAKASHACDSGDVSMVPAITSPQHTKQPVMVDVSLTTSAKKPCVFTPKGADPLAVISHDGDTVWDSSVCDRAVVSRPVQLVPGWATTVRVPWIPRESGDSCKPDEDWVDPGKYTLRVGTLGGEPGRADFTLVEPPPPPTPTPTPSPTAKPAPTPQPSAAQPPKPTPPPASAQPTD